MIFISPSIKNTTKESTNEIIQYIYYYEGRNVIPNVWITEECEHHIRKP